MTEHQRHPSSQRHAPPSTVQQGLTRLGRHFPTMRTALPVLFLAVIFAVGLVYVQQINTVATGGLALRDLDAKAQKLEADVRELEITAAALRSLATVNRVSDQLDLTTTAPVHYLPSVPSTVALGQ